MPSNPSPFNLSVCNYGTVKKEPYSLAVLPWGATEPHNYHLPYLTDTILSAALATDAAHAAFESSGARCMVLPPLWLGQQNPGQTALPFCLHSRYETQLAILTDIVSALRQQGLEKLVIVNGHGGNSFKPMIRDLALLHPHFLIALTDYFTLEKEAQSAIFEVEDNHAGEMETSLMLFYRPDLVQMEIAGEGSSKPFALSSLNNHTAWIPRNWEKVSADTGIGNPHKASAEKGAKFRALVVARLAQLFSELAQGDPYLPA
ncbi:MAG: creatininase family protein [Bacteroidales bacterium]